VIEINFENLQVRAASERGLGKEMKKVTSPVARTSFEIIAQQKLGHWLAWFEHCPETPRVGTSAWSAIAALIASFGWNVGQVDIVEQPADGTSVENLDDPEPLCPTLVLSVNSSCCLEIMNYVCELMEDSFDGVNGSINATSVGMGDRNLKNGMPQKRRSGRTNHVQPERPV
jgi:hypothetical protein